MIGIYCIINKLNNKKYIGQSVHIKERINQHKNLKNLSHHSAIDAAIEKYGWENFEWYVEEECSREELNEKEIYYINYYNTISPNGYNISTGGDAGISLDKYQEVSLYDKDGNRQQTFMSIHQAAEETSNSRQHISNQCRHLSTPEYDYFFEFGHEEHVTPPIRYRDTLRKQIYQYNIRTREYIQSFNSVADAARDAGDVSYNKNISACANGKRNCGYGYIWSYIKWDTAPKNYRDLNAELYELNRKNK